MRLSRHRAALALLLLAIGCQDHPPTAVVSAMAADATTLARVTHFRLSALRGGASKYDRVFPRDAFLHPGSLTFQDASNGDDRTMLRVRFEGYDQDPTTPGAAPIISNSARLPFVKEKTKLLRLGLSRECLDRTCASVDLTCRHGECVPDQIDDPDTELPDAPSGDGDTLDPGQFDDLPPITGGAAGAAGASGLGGVAGASGLGGEGGAAGTSGLGGVAGLGGAGAGGSSGSSTAPEFSLGSQMTCLRLAQGIKCWGVNLFGQLGYGDNETRGDTPATAPASLPVLPVAAESIAVGLLHVCVRLVDSSVRCWGYNGSGQLGRENVEMLGAKPGERVDQLPGIDLGSPPPATLHAGGYGSCIVRQGSPRTAVCWGLNNSGQLGLGDTQNRGDDPGEMGASLASIALGSGASDVQHLSVGQNFTCALVGPPAQIKCWGLNTSGQLGLGDTALRGTQPSQMGDALPFVSLSQTDVAAVPTRVVAGSSHACALLQNRTIKCWGNNERGQLGLGDSNHRGDQPGEMGDALPTVNLGTGVLATSVVAGDGHTCALTTDGHVKCWGANDLGQLGLGDTQNRGDQPGEMGDALPFVDLGTSASVSSLAAGDRHTCAVLTDGRLKCWGDNSHGQLGLGTTNNHGDGTNPMGDSLPEVIVGAMAP